MLNHASWAIHCKYEPPRFPSCLQVSSPYIRWAVFAGSAPTCKLAARNPPSRHRFATVTGQVSRPVNAIRSLTRIHAANLNAPAVAATCRSCESQSNTLRIRFGLQPCRSPAVKLRAALYSTFLSAVPSPAAVIRRCACIFSTGCC